MTMALISITSVWLSDIKMGYCSTGWWLNRKFCCLEVSEEGELCDEWRTWGGMEPFRYIAYILYAVSRCISSNSVRIPARVQAVARKPDGRRRR
jgi:chloride channel 3/4/5